MEELRSTDVLAREILEDARKKAFKILKTAEEAYETQAREMENKTMEAVNSMRKSYAEKTIHNKNETFARLPLDKRRLRSQAADNCLTAAMDDFLGSLPRKALLAILERELKDHLGECSEELALHRAEILYSGLELSEIKKFPGILSAEENISFREDPDSHKFPWLVINTPTARISVSVENAASALLKNKRAELAAALLGEGVLND